jgi:uncharacterized protein (TIGR03083 family)
MAETAWPTIHAERGALADDLGDLTDDQWLTPSLCAGWSVHDVLAHQVATAKMTSGKFIAKFAGAGFSFDRFAAKEIAAEGAGGPATTLAHFRQVQTATSSPPGPKDSWLGEALVHAEDIRRPLGISHAYPLPWVTRAIDFYTKSDALIGGKKRVNGLTLKATDTAYEHGSGPVVEGPAMSLLMAVCGRKPALDDLSGPGLEILRAR